MGVAASSSKAVTPSVDEGRFPAKRVVGDVVHVEADIFATVTT